MIPSITLTDVCISWLWKTIAITLPCSIDKLIHGFEYALVKNLYVTIYHHEANGIVEEINYSYLMRAMYSEYNKKYIKIIQHDDCVQVFIPVLENPTQQTYFLDMYREKDVEYVDSILSIKTMQIDFCAEILRDGNKITAQAKLI
jgi:hypothetical protein